MEILKFKMNVKKIIGTVLILSGLFLGYFGANKMASSSSSIKVLELEVGMSNKSEKELSYIYLGLAILTFGGGLYILKKK